MKLNSKYLRMTKTTSGTGSQPGQSGLMSPKSGQYKRQTSIDGLPLKVSYISRPWESLFNVLGTC